MGSGRPTVARILSLKSGLPPSARADARILILGSLPGDASLAARQYYAHPQNQFWKLVSEIIRQDVVAMEYAQRIAALQSAGIALWDVIGTASREGSLDHSIRGEQPNDLLAFVGTLPQLKVIAFNGNKAAASAAQAFSGTSMDTLKLPSSSAAYTLDVRQKAVAWSGLARYLHISPGARASREQIPTLEV